MRVASAGQLNKFMRFAVEINANAFVFFLSNA
jgi:hypothetical protein